MHVKFMVDCVYELETHVDFDFTHNHDCKYYRYYAYSVVMGDYIILTWFPVLSANFISYHLE